MGTPRSFHTWTLHLLPSLRWNISRSWGPYFPSQPEGMHSIGDCLEAGQRDQQRKEKPTGGLSTGLRSEGQLRVDILEERHTERPPCPRQNVSWLIISRWRAKYLPKEYLGLREWTYFPTACLNFTLGEGSQQAQQGLLAILIQMGPELF